jgi:hypothetical protein
MARYSEKNWAISLTFQVPVFFVFPMRSNRNDGGDIGVVL